MTVASSTGTSGQFLTSNGAGAYPSWTTSSVDQALDYTWTGLHAFNNATTTFRTIKYEFPNAVPINATSSVLVIASSTTLGFKFDYLPVATSTRSVLKNGPTDDIRNNFASTTYVGTVSTTTKSNAVTSYTRVKEMQIALPGIYTVCFEIRPATDSQIVNGRIYVDDVATGTEQTASGGTVWVPFCEDITVGKFAKIQSF